MRRLFLDDIRTPKGDWDIVRTYNEFVNYIGKYGIPDFISFDHDLGYDKLTLEDSPSGYDCARYLIDNNLGLPRYGYNVHSMNPVGANNIVYTLNSYGRYANLIVDARLYGTRNFIH